MKVNEPGIVCGGIVGYWVKQCTWIFLLISVITGNLRDLMSLLLIVTGPVMAVCEDGKCMKSLIIFKAVLPEINAASG